MKQKLLQTVFMLSSVLLGMGLGIGKATGKDQHGYILRYYVDVPTNSGSGIIAATAVTGISQWPLQYPTTHKEERFEYFPILELAQQRMNSSFCPNPGAVLSFCYGPISGDDFIGLYRAEEIPVSQVKVGSEKKLIQKTEEVEVDKLEWRVKP